MGFDTSSPDCERTSAGACSIARSYLLVGHCTQCVDTSIVRSSEMTAESQMGCRE
jgi:hypothetical protein